MTTTVTDVAFDDASDVQSIPYRLHPIDVGFDLRAEQTVMTIANEATIRVSYPAQDGSRRVMEGPRAKVLSRLRKLGFRFSEE